MPASRSYYRRNVEIARAKLAMARAKLQIAKARIAVADAWYDLDTVSYQSANETTNGAEA